MPLKSKNQIYHVQITQFPIYFPIIQFQIMHSLIHISVIIGLAINVCWAQIGEIVNGPISYVGDPHYPRITQRGSPIAVTDPDQLAHPAVVANSIAESQLPPELLKSHRFYSNPRIAAGLTRASWLTDKEGPVFQREADNIPREQVFKLFRNAGFISRRKRFVRF